MKKYLLLIAVVHLYACKKKEINSNPYPKASVLTCKVYGRGYFDFKSEGGNPQHDHVKDSLTFYSTALPEDKISFTFQPDSINSNSVLEMSINPPFGQGVYKSTNNKIVYNGGR